MNQNGSKWYKQSMYSGSKMTPHIDGTAVRLDSLEERNAIEPLSSIESERGNWWLIWMN